MKKILITVMSCLLISFAVQAGKGKPKKVKMKTEVDSVSYSIGIAVGRDLKKQLLVTMTDSVYNSKLLISGLTHAINGDSTIISSLDADTIVLEYMKAVNMRKQAEFNMKEEKRIAENVNFLVENAKKEGVVSLPSGLQYIVEKEGEGAKPVDTSLVKVNYAGTLIDGTEFDSSYKRGEPISFQLNQVIKGWTEGVQLMTIGSKYKFFIPSDLAYGDRKQGPIPASSTLIFVVELLDIEKPAAPVIEAPKEEAPKAPVKKSKKSNK